MRRELGGATPPLRPLAPIGAPAPSTGTAAMDHTTAGAVGASVSVPAPPAALAAAKAYQEAQEQLLLQQQQAAASSVGNAEHSTTNTMVRGARAPTRRSAFPQALRIPHLAPMRTYAWAPSGGASSHARSSVMGASVGVLPLPPLRR